ncbi:uncharacterized protein PAF06_016445 [Gastrophryne carolinensis]
MMESAHYNMQYHQPWVGPTLYHKEWPNMINPVNNPVTWKQSWLSDIEPMEREMYESHAKPVPLQIYSCNSSPHICVTNEIHARCGLQHLPPASSDIRYEHSFSLPYNHVHTVHHKDVLEEVTSQWITAGTELIKVATIPISRLLLKAPENMIGNASEPLRDYEPDFIEEQPQKVNGAISIPNAERDTGNIPSFLDSIAEDPGATKMNLSSEQNDSSNTMAISNTVEEEREDDKVSDCSSAHKAPQEQDDASVTEETKFLLINDRGIPYIVFKDDVLSSVQTDDLDDLSQGPRGLNYCPICFRSFLYLSDLERHSITHSERKPYECKVCGKSFKRSSHLQRHKHIHTGERPFICEVCHKAFRVTGELQRHKRVHTGEKPYQCEICFVRFTERNTLRRHIKRKHSVQNLLQQYAAESNDWEESLKHLVEDGML